MPQIEQRDMIMLAVGFAVAAFLFILFFSGMFTQKKMASPYYTESSLERRGSALNYYTEVWGQEERRMKEDDPNYEIAYLDGPQIQEMRHVGRNEYEFQFRDPLYEGTDNRTMAFDDPPNPDQGPRAVFSTARNIMGEAAMGVKLYSQGGNGQGNNGQSGDGVNMG